MWNIFVKKNSIFLIGFIVGFNIAFLCIFLQYISKIYNPLCVKQSQKLQENISSYVSKKETYKKWLQKQNVFFEDLNMDFYLHGPKFNTNEDSKTIIESKWLKDRVHITCVVFIEKRRMLEPIKNTWGNRCNKLYFFGKRKKKEQNLLKSVIYFDIKIDSSWHYLCETFNYIWRTKNKTNRLEWVIFVNEDTLVISENLRFLVAPLNFKNDFYLGHAITMWRQKYNVAQAGYVLSTKTLQKLVTKFNNSEKCASGGKYWKMEDFYLGQHLEELNVHPSDTRDSKLRGIFHGYSLQALMWGIARPTNYWTKALFPTGSAGCCSPLSVTFAVNEANKLYTLNYLLYHLHVYTNIGVYGNKPAPTAMPEEEVWKTVLKEEFGFNNITEMSHEQYYNIWRSIYSEPEEFIARNFKNVPSAFKSDDFLKDSSKHPSVK